MYVSVCMEARGREQTKPLCFCVRAGASQAGTNLTEPQINGLSGCCSILTSQPAGNNLAVHSDKPSHLLYNLSTYGKGTIYIAHVGHSSQPQHC